MLVLRPGALGDALLAVPALRALRRAYGPVTFAGHAGAARFLAEVGEVGRGLAFDDPLIGRVLTAEAWTEPVVAWMTEAPPFAMIGAASRPHDMQRHCARYLLETLAPLSIDLTFDAQPLRVRSIASEAVLVHVGSGSRTKNWPPRCFADAIRVLDAPIKLVVGEADVEAATVVEALLGRSLPRLEQPPLDVLAAQLAGCRAYLGNDSGVSHLAGLCGARTVALFGPTDPTVWRPVGPHVRVVPFDADPSDVAVLL